MTISQLNGTNPSPVPSLTTIAQKASSSNTGNPAIESRIGGAESAEQIKQAVHKIQGTVNNLAQNFAVLD